MTDKLPPNLLKLFAPRPPLPFLPSLDKPLDERRGPYLTGVGEFLKFLGGSNLDYAGTPTAETLRKERISRKKKLAEDNRKRQIEAWKVFKDSDQKDPTGMNLTRDPFRTVFVARLPSNITEEKLRECFEQFGRVVSVKRVLNTRTQKPRRYAFVEFEKERDAVTACRESDGLRVEGQRLMVDVERGRTVRDWKPRRLGGGIKAVTRPALSSRSSFGDRPSSAGFRSSGGPPPRRDGESSDFYRKRDRSPPRGGDYRPRSQSPKRRR